MKLKTQALVFAAYLILSIILTHPLALEFTSKVPGYYDVWQNVWNFWWMEKAVFELKTSPYHTQYLFHPTGVGLSFHTLNPGNSLPGALLARRFSLAIAYNTLVLLSFVLAGYGMFLLAHYVTGDKHASFFAGIVYAFSPYHFLELGIGHLNLLSIQWIPFYVLYLMKTFREGGMKNTALATLTLFLVSSTCLQYGGFMALFTLFFLIFAWKTDRSGFLLKLKRVIPAFILAGLLMLPIVAPMLSAMASGEGARPVFSTSVYYSQDIVSFLAPNSMHPLWGGIGKKVSGIISSRNGYGGVNSAGYVVLGLLFLHFNRQYSIIERAKSFGGNVGKNRLGASLTLLALIVYGVFLNRGGYLSIPQVWATLAAIALACSTYFFLRRTRLGFWEASLIVFGILALGPLIQLAGYVTLPGPYLLLYFVPGFRIFRVPARFDLLFMLSAAVICAKALSKIRASKGKLIVYVLSIILLIEFLSAPVHLSDVAAPEFYKRIGSDNGEYAIIDVPVSPIRFRRGESLWENGLPRYMLYQTFHGKKMVGGYVSYPTREAKDFIDGNVFLRRLKNLEGEDNRSVTEIVDVGRKTLSENNIRYVIVHKDILSDKYLYRPETLNETIKSIEDLLQTETPVFADETIMVFERKDG